MGSSNYALKEDCHSFFELLQVASSCRVFLSGVMTDEEWKAIFAIAQKQAVVGFAFDALEGIVGQGQKIPQALLFEWIGLSEQIKQRNRLVSQRCKQLEKLFVDGGFRCCVLKGQGTALYYQNPLCRQSGDIDVWVTKDGRCETDDVRSEVLSFFKGKGYHIGHVDIKHSDVDIFEDVPVEVHFIPSWMYSPWKNKILQRFFNVQANTQSQNYDKNTGFTHTTVDFDLVFSLVHIYRHVFDEGIGLRQLLDYYHILIHSKQTQREDAYKVLVDLGMCSFVGGVMCVLKKCFALSEEYYLCGVNERHGRFLLSEILAAGNFGHFDERNKHYQSRWANGIQNVKRNLRFLKYYPSEVLWSPLWKVWHWGWRKRKGYL